MGFINPYYVVFLSYRVFTLQAAPQIWRIATTFMLTSPKFGMILDPYFLYLYGSSLETEASRFSNPGDFFVYLIFVCVWILVSLLAFPCTFPSTFDITSYICPVSLLWLSRFLETREITPALCDAHHSQILKGLSGVWAWWDSILRKLSAVNLWLDGGLWALHTRCRLSRCLRDVETQDSILTGLQLLGGIWLQGMVLLSPLTLALAYTYAQENPQRQMNYFIVTFSAKWLPYLMLAMTFVMDSPAAALLQATGLVAAHLYDFLTKYWPEYGGGRRIVWTPQFVQQWFAPAPGAGRQRGYGTAFAGRPANVPQQRTGSSGGWASGFSGGGSGGAWGSRGAGHRLGGN